MKIYFGNAAEFNPENYYELPDYTVNEFGEVFDKDNKRLKEETKHCAYKYVYLDINGVKTNCKIHRIVACTFPDICGEFNEVVNHLDENKHNNSASNLRWTTNKENLEWGTIRERQRKAFKETNKIKKFLKVIYESNFLKYSKNVKIKKLKTCYKFVDKLNNICVYFSLKDVEYILENKDKEFPKRLFLEEFTGNFNKQSSFTS